MTIVERNRGLCFGQPFGLIRRGGPRPLLLSGLLPGDKLGFGISHCDPLEHGDSRQKHVDAWRSLRMPCPDDPDTTVEPVTPAIGEKSARVY
jgi:hypothetical protein